MLKCSAGKALGYIYLFKVMKQQNLTSTCVSLFGLQVTSKIVRSLKLINY